MYHFYDIIMINKKGTKMLIEIDKSIKKLLQNQIEKYKEGNKKALSIILNLIKRDITKLLNENELTIKLTKTIIEDTLGISIKDDTFYKWVRRNIKKSNIKGVKEVSQPTPVKETKPKRKEMQNVKVAQKNGSKSPKAILEEIKNTGVEEDFDRNAGKTKFLDDI